MGIQITRMTHITLQNSIETKLNILLFKLCPHQSYQDNYVLPLPKLYYFRMYANFGIKNKLKICYIIVYVFVFSEISKGPNYRANNLALLINIHHVIQGL